MADMPTVDSVMQPTITFRPSLRASAIMRRAGVKPPHFTSLMLIPWKRPWHLATSASVMQLSSANKGNTERAYTSCMPSRSSAFRGCSINSTPSGCICRAFSNVSATAQAQLASTRNTASVCRRNSRTMATSSGVPSLIL